MQPIQLEFNSIDIPVEEVKFLLMQKQLEAMNESMHKVRKSLFAQLTEVQKLCLSLKDENAELKNQLKDLRIVKNEWVYHQNDSLFQKAS